MTIPNLQGVIKASDVLQKGGSGFKASYVPWAKTAALLQQHAPGWEFHLQPFEDRQLVHPAPDNTGYLVGYFTCGEEATADFPFPVMDARNNPVPLDKISARTLTDSHRRAFCAAAAWTFGLAYELWAKEEIGDDEPLSTPPVALPDAKPAAAKTTAKPAAKPADAPAPANSKAFDAGAKAIAAAKTLDALQELGERLTARFEAGDITQSERDLLLKQLLDKETDLAG